jgi:hypothetical protein
VLKEEARRKTQEEDEAKEEERIKKEKEAAKLASVGFEPPKEDSPPKLRRRTSSVQADFMRISQKRREMGKSNDKKITSDSQFYESRDCHTMRKFIRKRNAKITKVQETRAEEQKNAHNKPQGDDDEDGELTVKEEYSYANIGRIIITNSRGEKVAALKEKSVAEGEERADVSNRARSSYPLIRANPRFALAQVQLELDEDFDDDEWEEDDTLDGAWKASVTTPYIKSEVRMHRFSPLPHPLPLLTLPHASQVLDAIPDEDSRKMEKNIGVSISMDDEKTSTEKFLGTLGEARRKRANMESIRLKSNDQFMLIGHAQALLNQKHGAGAVALPPPVDLADVSAGPSLSDSDHEDDHTPRCPHESDDETPAAPKRSVQKKEAKAPAPAAAASAVELLADDPSVASSKESQSTVPVGAADARSQGTASVSFGGALQTTDGDESSVVSSHHSHNTPGALPISAAEQEELKETEKKSGFFASRPRTNTSIDRESSRVRGSMIRARPRTVSDMRQESQRKLEIKEKQAVVLHYDKSPLEAAVYKGPLSNPDVVGMYQHYPLKKNGFDPQPEPEPVEEKVAAEPEEMKEERVGEVAVGAGRVKILGLPDPQPKSRSVSRRGSLRSTVSERTSTRSLESQKKRGSQSKLFVRGSSSTVLGERRPSRAKLEVEVEAGDMGLIENSPSLESSVGITNISASVSLMSNESIGDGDVADDNSFVGSVTSRTSWRGEGEDVECDESVDDIVSTIMSVIEGSQKGGVDAAEEKEKKREKKLKGSMHVGPSGLKHKYATGSDIEPSPALALKQKDVVEMKLENAHSHHFGKPNIFPKLSDAPASTPGSTRPNTSSSLRVVQSRMNTASSWNTISSLGDPNSRPTTGMSGGLSTGGGGRTRPGSSNVGNVRLSESSGVRMVRSSDGEGYVYMVYDEARNKLNTPAAVPTQMLFDEEGKAYVRERASERSS